MHTVAHHAFATGASNSSNIISGMRIRPRTF
jgi:hypothetical protein